MLWSQRSNCENYYFFGVTTSVGFDTKNMASTVYTEIPLLFNRFLVILTSSLFKEKHPIFNWRNWIERSNERFNFKQLIQNYGVQTQKQRLLKIFKREENNVVVLLSRDSLKKLIKTIIKQSCAYWKLFWKMLCYKYNKKPTVPIEYAVNWKESFKTMSTLMILIKYEEHKLKVCSDFKIIGLLLGLQCGYVSKE